MAWIEIFNIQFFHLYANYFKLKFFFSLNIKISLIKLIIVKKHLWFRIYSGRSSKYRLELCVCVCMSMYVVVLV